MDPRKAECHGYYLYGTGYFADETKHLTGYSFCNECRFQASCQDLHQQRVGHLQPAAVENFEAQRRMAARRGIGGHLFALLRARKGDPDPYARAAVENYKRGSAARRADEQG